MENLPLRYMNKFNSLDVYIHGGINNFLRACKLIQIGGYFYTDEPIQIKANSIRMFKFSDIKGTSVLHKKTGLAGTVTLSLDNGYFCYVYWLTGFDYGWCKYDDILMLT